MPSNIQKPPRDRRDSSELEVFEAERYFSGSTEVASFNNRLGYHERKSMEMPMRDKLIPPQPPKVHEDCTKKYKMPKQPTSPGGRLASFLNSLFQLAVSKKSKSVRDERKENQCVRKRRSSINHSHSIRSNDSKPYYSYQSSVPAKVQEDLRRKPRSVDFFQQREVVTYQPRMIEGAKFHAIRLYGEHNMVVDDENKLCLKRNGKGLKKDGDGGIEIISQKRWFQRDEDSDVESDDLFELKNYDLGDTSSCQPVHGPQTGRS